MAGLESKMQSDQVDFFFQAILKLETIDECYNFFEDICTAKEINSIAQRIEVAKLLALKKTYKEIEKKTGASTATISRVNRFLNYGTGGYDMILEKLNVLDENKENGGK